LERWPLYISLDKDVMVADEAAVNWDSGHLDLKEVQKVLNIFTHNSDRRLVGLDIVGDWSPVRMKGLFRKFLHWTEHPPLRISTGNPTAQNTLTNLALLDAILAEQSADATRKQRVVV